MFLVPAALKVTIRFFGLVGDHSAPALARRCPIPDWLTPVAIADKGLTCLDTAQRGNDACDDAAFSILLFNTLGILAFGALIWLMVSSKFCLSGGVGVLSNDCIFVLAIREHAFGAL
jgi:hypothetical protein